MDLKFNIETNCSCETIVTNITPYTEYLIEEEGNEFSTSKFVKNHSVVFIRLNKMLDKPTYFYGRVENNKVIIKDVPDGWYKLEAIILPDKEYLQRASELGGDMTYYYAGEGDIICDFKEQTCLTEKGLELLFTKLADLGVKEFNKKYFAFSFVSDYVSICNLRKCYINYNNKILTSMSGSICSTGINSSDTFNRDLLRMILDSIRYLVECNRLNEADRLIKQIYSCNGSLCKQPKTMSAGGCGCRG